MSNTRITDWYATLSPRDQRVLMIGSAAVALILLIGVFLPVQRNIQDTRTKLQTQQDDLAWMRQVGPAIAASGPGPVNLATPDSLVVLVDTSARESGLGQAVKGSQPSNNGAVQVQLEAAEFNAMTNWISRLSAQNGVKIEAATVTASNAPGIVNATVQLRAR